MIRGDSEPPWTGFAKYTILCATAKMYLGSVVKISREESKNALDMDIAPTLEVISTLDRTSSLSAPTMLSIALSNKDAEEAQLEH